MLVEALYLPQFHSFKENDEWWGKGFTEWENLRNARRLHKHHKIIKNPVWGEYNLLDENVLAKQFQYAKKIGVDIFSVYHYWSDGHLLMEKPIENLLKNNDIEFKFYFNWANHHFFNKVHFSKKKLLWKQKYSQKYINNHVKYLYKAMIDDRYHKIEGKPVFNIYDPRNIPDFNRFVSEYKETFINEFNIEIHLRVTLKDYRDFSFVESNRNIIDSVYEYQPVLANHHNLFQHYYYEFNLRLKRDILKKLTIINSKNVVKRITNGSKKIHNLPYGFGAYTGWDTTPRWNSNGIVHINFDEELFQRQISAAKKKSSNDDFLVITAWNEWGEGAVLEPCKERKNLTLI